jgi:glycosyltransferase involved in cell wall biosynthesis
MIRVLHLTEDAVPDSVNRALQRTMHCLDPMFLQAQRSVAPNNELPPCVAADILIVHVAMSWQKLPWLLLLRQRNPSARIVLVIHNLTRAFEALHVSRRGRFRTMLKMACAIVHRVVTLSETQTQWLSEVASVPRNKVRVINPHTDLVALRMLPPPVRGHGPLQLAAYGRFAPQAGFDTLIKAMQLVSPDVAELRLVGLGPDEAILWRLAKDLPHVSIEAPMRDPSALLRWAHAVAIPSRYEAFGTAGLEARAAARPIIASAVDGLCEQALPIPELCVQPDDAPTLARSIEWLAAQNLGPLATAARFSTAGAERHTAERWNTLLSALAPSRFQAMRGAALTPAIGGRAS